MQTPTPPPVNIAPPELIPADSLPASINPAEQLNYAVTLLSRGQIAEAEQVLAALVTSHPSNADAQHFLGVVAIQTGRVAEGVEMIRKAVRRNPKLPAAYCNLAIGLNMLKEYEEALKACARAVSLMPIYPEAWHNRGSVLRTLGRAEEALACFDKAVAQRAGFTDAINARLNTLTDLGRYDAALAGFAQVLEMNPQFDQISASQAVWLRNTGHLDGAIAAIDRAIIYARKPTDLAEYRAAKGIMLLMRGDFAEGWRLCESRRELAEPITNRVFAQPLWLGEQDIEGKHLFLYWEQGLGDTIQFSRYALMARARGAQVTLAVQDQLLQFMRQLEPDVRVIGAQSVPESFDLHAPLMSLPLAMGTTVETIPAYEHYLAADPALRRIWAPRLPSDGRTRIGFVWRGSAAHRFDNLRSIPAEQMPALLTGKHAWVSLQRDLTSAEETLLAARPEVVNLGDEFIDFADTAAAIAELDLVITVDTSIAHLAGAMGKKVWILLHLAGEWRWLTGRSDSPWYPSARLFRQTTMNDWQSVFTQVEAALAEEFGT